jgi:hypothetical protein
MTYNGITAGSIVNKSNVYQKRTAGDIGGLEDIDENYRPSEWLSEVMPKKSPYFPQLGDDLVYFRQGHENYIDLVKKSNIYPLSKKYLKSLPWCTNSSLPVRFHFDPESDFCSAVFLICSWSVLDGGSSSSCRY